MTVDRLIIETRPGEVRIAGLKGDAAPGRALSFFKLFRDDGPLPQGAVVLGRVRALASNVNAAFVDIGEDADGFLNAADAAPPGADAPSRIGEGVHEGEAVLVEVVRAAEGEKGAKLSRRITHADTAEFNAAAENATPPAVLAGADRRAVIESVLARFADAEVLPESPNAFAAAGIEDEVDALFAPDVALPGGGRLRIDEAEALSVIDVDTGAAHGPGAGLAVNLEAAAEIARQLALRSIGGLVVVDFVSLRKKGDMMRVVKALGNALAGDARVSGPTAAGLVEITRPRSGPSLLRQTRVRRSGWVKTPETTALEALARITDEDRARPGRVRGIAAAPAVIAAIKASPARAEVEHRLGRTLDVRAEDGFAGDGFELLMREAT